MTGPRAAQPATANAAGGTLIDMSDDGSQPAGDGPIGRPRRGRRAVLAATAAAVLAVVASLVLWPARPWRDGPIEAAPTGTMSGLRMSVGEQATWGGVYIHNTATQPVTLRAVQLGGGIDGTHDAVSIEKVEVIDPSAVAEHIGMAAGAGLDVVPQGHRHPIEGYRLAPGAYAELLVRYRAERQGTWRWDYADVEYSADGRRYTVRMPQALAVCADTGDTCNPGTPPN